MRQFEIRHCPIIKNPKSLHTCIISWGAKQILENCQNIVVKLYRGRTAQNPSRLICNKDTLHNFLCCWMAQGIKQDLILKEKESKLPNYIQFNWIKSWDKLGQIDSLFWQKIVFPLIGFLKRLNLTEKVVWWKLE